MSISNNQSEEPLRYRCTVLLDRSFSDWIVVVLYLTVNFPMAPEGAVTTF